METTMPLNPALYRLLERRFGKVRIENQGCGAARRFVPGALGSRRVHQGGTEEYVVRCPFCGDASGHGHLYINHRYGTADGPDGGRNMHLAHCFRCDCLEDPEKRRELFDMIFSVHNGQPLPPPRACYGPAAPRRPGRVSRPGYLMSLTALHPTFPARAYLEGRGYDVAELESAWGVAYCVEPCACPEMVGRLYVPVVQGGQLVGWQGRYPAELDWKATGVSKYYNMPGLRKGQLLYNLDQARGQPLVVVVEGVTDAWRVGPAAVALFGKTASEAQVQLLAACWRGQPVVILLDADAPEEAEKLRRRLEAFKSSPVVVAELPDGLDPGVCPRGLLWEFLRATALEQGVTLPGPAPARPPAAARPSRAVKTQAVSAAAPADKS
jgi:hypothetical protein